MNSYNGFSPEVREESNRWIKAEIAAGRLRPPARCSACGETQGVIDYHAEDYSKPFTAAKLCACPLCFRCHITLHGRYRDRRRWLRYIEQLEAGAVYEPIQSRREIHRLNEPGWAERPVRMGPPRGVLAFFRSLSLERPAEATQRGLF